MKTKDRIIFSAVDYFNQHGFQRSSLKSLAAEMGISDGNLRYHFRTKGDLAMAIYLKLHSRINEGMEQRISEEINLWAHYHFIRDIFQAFWDYRFTQIEAARIMESYPEIGQKHNEIYRQRKEIFKKVLHAHITGGEIVLPDWEGFSDYLFDQYFIIAGSWIRFALLEESDPAELIEHYAKVNLSLFLPYATEKGRQQLKEIL